MKVYLANKKGFIRYILMGAILLAFVIFLLDKATFTEKPFIVLPLLIPILLILWIYLDTVYKIAEYINLSLWFTKRRNRNPIDYRNTKRKNNVEWNKTCSSKEWSNY